MTNSVKIFCSPRLLRGFTLIELLVVIAIIGLLMAVLMPSLQRARGTAKRVICSSNFGQIGLGMSMYALDNKNILPESPDHQRGYYWSVPVLESISGYVGGLNESVGWTGNNADKRYPSIFKCPSTPSAYYGYSDVVNISYFLVTAGPWFWKNTSQWSIEPPHRTDQNKSIHASGLPFSKVVAADVIWYWANGGMWYGNHIRYIGGGRSLNEAGLKGKNTNPGSNSLYLDGHVEWRNIDEMKQYVTDHYY